MKRHELFNLPFWNDIEAKLLAGDPILGIARSIQCGGFFEEVKLKTLCQMLSRIANKLKGKPIEGTKASKRYMIQSHFGIKRPDVQTQILRPKFVWTIQIIIWNSLKP